MNQEMKKKISDSMKNYLANNPDVLARRVQRMRSVDNHTDVWRRAMRLKMSGEHSPAKRPDVRTKIGLANTKPKVICQCSFCGNQFGVTPCRGGTARYCSRKCMNSAKFGKLHSQETLLKMRVSASRGAESRFWNGGVSVFTKTERRRLMQSGEYQAWRKSVFVRDGYKCQMPFCKVPVGSYVEANHILTYKDYPQFRLALKNGITLCQECHRSIRNKEEQYERSFLLQTA